MRSTVRMWKCKLEKEIKQCASKPVSLDTLTLSHKLGETWLLFDDMCRRLGIYESADDAASETVEQPAYYLTDDDIRWWNSHMKNSDGTEGGHWSEDQTTTLANAIGVTFGHITPLEWNVTCNMMYSDYYDVAANMGIDGAAFYGGMAKAFLFDKDGPTPKKKLCAYFHHIVK